MSGQVHTVCVSAQQLGGSGGTLPPENLGAMRLLLKLFLGQYNASRRPDNRVSYVNIYPFCPLHCTPLVSVSINCSLITQAHLSQMRLVKLQSLAWKNEKLLEGRLGRVFTLLAAISQVLGQAVVLYKINFKVSH